MDCDHKQPSNMMLGPDHFEFEQTPDTKHCIVAPQSMPKYEYDHQRWEEEFAPQLPKPFKTPEPPRKKFLNYQLLNLP